MRDAAALDSATNVLNLEPVQPADRLVGAADAIANRGVDTFRRRPADLDDPACVIAHWFLIPCSNVPSDRLNSDATSVDLMCNSFRSVSTRTDSSSDSTWAASHPRACALCHSQRRVAGTTRTLAG